MERENKETTERAVTRTHEDPRRTHPARPEQLDASFAKGIAADRDVPDEPAEPDFARGVRQAPRPHRHGRFSWGIEDPDARDKEAEGRFSTGIEQHAHSR